MAKKPTKTKSNQFFSFLRQMALTPPPEKTISKTTLDTDGGTSLSTSERNELMKRITQTTGGKKPRGGSDAFGKYIKPMTQRISQIKFDNEAMRTLCPEIKTAENIVIPSIISPTDMRDGEITISSTSQLVDDDQNNKISELLHEHFNKKLGLSAKLPEWIRESLYGAGSKPIMVLPITELDIIMNDPDAVLAKTVSSSYSNEALSAAMTRLDVMDKVELPSIFGIGDQHIVTGKGKQDPRTANFALEDLRPAMESVFGQFVTTVGATPKKTDSSYNLEGLFKGGPNKELKQFALEALESISISDNPDVLKVDKAKKAKQQAKMKRQIVVHYKSKSIITVNQENGASRGNPVVYELPPESVIPIFTPGTPTDHIGYFVCVDEFGNPLHMSEEMMAGEMNDARRTSPGALYKAFGSEAHFSLGEGNGRNERDALMTGIYQTIIEAHLKGRLKESGINNVYIGAQESVYRCMFARYLSARKTKLLFVPKDFITYFCFKHNSDGTGRSQIEDIRFILSLKITLMICRMMASMNNAINRKKIDINFTEEMGDPIQYMEILTKEAIDKSIVNFTYDPSEITRTLAQRSITINAKGIPGAENLEISQEANEQQNIKPDETLIDDINNLMVMAFEIPPSAMNLLSENEFSRSVATNNIFFSRNIHVKQKAVCKHTGHHVQTYVHMSEQLKGEISAILKQGLKDKKGKGKDAGTADDDTKSIDDLLADVILNITATLPAPDVAPNKTEFEELGTMITAVTSALEGVFDDGLSSDDPIPLIRAIIKSDIIREYMQRIGVSKDALIPSLDAAFTKRIIEWKHQLLNTKAGLLKANEFATPGGAPTDADTSGFGGGDTTGGAPSDDGFGSPTPDLSTPPSDGGTPPASLDSGGF